jgi:crossover junction endodeoxyribonuclease RusA
MSVHKAKKKAKRVGGEAVIAAGRPRFPKDAPLAVTLTFHPPRGAPDEDNAIASLKAYLDGIAGALGVDDKLFRLQRPIMAERVKGGRVLVSIEIAQ